MLFNKKRVDEDLEKIRRANLHDKSTSDISVSDETKATADEIKLEKGDLTAMILAVFSLILPYLLVFIAIMIAVVFLLGHYFSIL